MESIAINPSNVFKTIQEHLIALKAVDYSQLTHEEKDEMRKELLELRELALNIKKRIEE